MNGGRSSARAYLISLGLPADRLRTVSYGKEFPFDPGHDEVGVREESARALRHHGKVSVMKIKTFGALLSLAVVATLALPSPAAAADKETRQMMADIRILQEQSQQLQNLIAALVATLSEAIKAVNARLEEQTNANRKSLADQKLVIDTMANDLRVLREKVDDNNVRVGSLGQEIDALRQSVSSMNAPRPFGFEAAGGDPAAAGGGTPHRTLVRRRQPVLPASGRRRRSCSMARSPTTSPASTISRRMGFESYVKTFPQSPEAPDAQLRVGNSYLQSGKNDKAVEAYDVVIRTYPKSSSVPEAYCQEGHGAHEHEAVRPRRAKRSNTWSRITRPTMRQWASRSSD